MKKTLFLNGIVVGEVESTGDIDRDIEVARQFLDERGLRKEVSLFQGIYNQAVAFSTTSAYLHERDLRRPPPRKGASVAPFVVNSAFAIELYLKALAQKHGHSLRGHELLKLYKALPKVALIEIEKVRGKCALDRGLSEDITVASCLRDLNNAFVNWRYSYELERAGPIHIEPTIFVMQALHEACHVPTDA